MPRRRNVRHAGDDPTLHGFEEVLVVREMVARHDGHVALREDLVAAGDSADVTRDLVWRQGRSLFGIVIVQGVDEVASDSGIAERVGISISSFTILILSCFSRSRLRGSA